MAKIIESLAKAMYDDRYDPNDLCDEWMYRDAEQTLDNLTKLGFILIEKPEGVAVAHGARLARVFGEGLYTIEDAP